MRNLSQYPLRDEEVLDWLDKRMEEHLAKMLFGSMEGVILQKLKECYLSSSARPSGNTE